MVFIENRYFTLKGYQFTKMHALGNDFVLIDHISQQHLLTKANIIALANRKTGIGFDQLLVVENSHQTGVDFHCRIFNADGSEVGQCGNGVRCFARFVYEKGLSHKKQIIVSTHWGLMQVEILPNNEVKVDMGLPVFSPAQIPYIANGEQLTYQLENHKFGLTNIGNPHCTLLVDDIDNVEVNKIGHFLMAHQNFPEQVNVGFMQVINKNTIKLRVYERGVGETQACGSGACAAMSYGVRLGLLNTEVCVHLPGGRLVIVYQQGGHIMMTGEAVFVYDGQLY